jgi:hypothetical protein
MSRSCASRWGNNTCQTVPECPIRDWLIVDAGPDQGTLVFSRTPSGGKIRNNVRVSDQFRKDMTVPDRRAACDGAPRCERRRDREPTIVDVPPGAEQVIQEALSVRPAFGVREPTAHTGVVAEIAQSIGAGPIALGLADEVRARGEVVDVRTMF